MYQVSEAWRMHSYPQKPNTTGKERHFHAEDAGPATSIKAFQLLSSPWRSLASVAPEGEVHCRTPWNPVARTRGGPSFSILAAFSSVLCPNQPTPTPAGDSIFALDRRADFLLLRAPFPLV
ncbi:hypothetical protein FSOLCH5_000994 [Fusarium solani]